MGIFKEVSNKCREGFRVGRFGEDVIMKWVREED